MKFYTKRTVTVQVSILGSGPWNKIPKEEGKSLHQRIPDGIGIWGIYIYR